MIEARPDNAPEWPADAVERVTFSAADPTLPEEIVAPSEVFPLAVYLDRDGWPQAIPASLRPEDPLYRYRRELARRPWLTDLIGRGDLPDAVWRDRLALLERTVWEEFVAWQASHFRALAPHLPPRDPK